jgi:hypothetical protein
VAQDVGETLSVPCRLAVGHEHHASSSTFTIERGDSGVRRVPRRRRAESFGVGNRQNDVN